MKQLRLVFASLAMVAAAAWAIAAIAGDKKTATAASAHGSCTQMTSAECQARMAAGDCPMHHGDAAATTAGMSGECSAHGMKTATAKAAGQCPYSGATTTASDAGCAAHGATTTTASTGSMDACCAGGAKTTTAATVSTTPAADKTAGSCSTHGAATTASANCGGKTGATMKGATAAHGCPNHNTSMMAAGLGSNCVGDGMTAHIDCEACSDLATCDAELQAAGAAMQTVPIKNGVMFVYTAKAPGGVNAIQSVMTRRTEHLARFVAGGSKARLCDDCRSMRGEMASGRLVREVVNIEGGALVLVTSADPTMVKRIRALADGSKMAVKS